MNSNQIQTRLEQLARARLLSNAIEVRNEVIDELSHPGTGRTYKRRSRTHQASAPGKPPAVDTKRLWQSISIDSSELSNLKVRIGTNVVYAPGLEFGSRNVSPRPFLRPAFERWKRSRP